MVAADRVPAVISALRADPAVASTTMLSLSTDERLMHVSVELKDDPFSGAAIDAVPRSAGHRAARGGGRHRADRRRDRRDARLTAGAASDAALIVPLTLVLILLIVAALVRALVAPLYLVATVVLSYAFALGVSTLTVFGDSDPALPLFAFIFLVALGVDYNIFLIGRIREEHAALHDARAVIAGLTRTGGVITSAGLILAGTFATLMAIPIEGLIQIGFTIAFGLLVDTFAVRDLPRARDCRAPRRAQLVAAEAFADHPNKSP